MCPCGILYCTFNGTLLAVESLCEVLTKYTVGINPSCIQFKSTHELIKTIKVDRRSRLIVIFVYHLCFCTIVMLLTKVSKSLEVCGVKETFWFSIF